MTEKHKTPPEPAARIDTGYLLVTRDVPGYAAGRVVPSTPETVAALKDAARPATEHEIGVAGIMKRG